MRRLVWGLLTIHLFSVGPAFSQAEGNGENLPRFRFNTSVDAVHLSVSVVTKKGKLVTDLEQSDFWVLENDVIQDKRKRYATISTRLTAFRSIGSRCIALVKSSRWRTTRPARVVHETAAWW